MSASCFPPSAMTPFLRCSPLRDRPKVMPYPSPPTTSTVPSQTCTGGQSSRDGGFGKFVHHRELYPIDGPTFTREQIGTRKTPSNITQHRNNGGTIYKLSVRLQGTDPRFARQLERSIYRRSDLSKLDAGNASPIAASTGRRSPRSVN